MEIIAIYRPYIYSIKHDAAVLNEFDRLFGQWSDLGSVLQFFDTYQEFLNTPFWSGVTGPEDAALQVLNEARELRSLFDEMNKNTRDGDEDDFDSHFRYLDGKYKYELEWPPMKSYGTRRPSFLRIYAIRMDTNTYLITGGGIKLTEKIQDAPGLKDHVLSDIDKVRDFLKANGIFDSDDMESD